MTAPSERCARRRFFRVLCGHSKEDHHFSVAIGLDICEGCLFRPSTFWSTVRLFHRHAFVPPADKEGRK